MQAPHPQGVDCPMSLLVKPAVWKASRATKRHQDVSHSTLAAQAIHMSVHHEKAHLGAAPCKAARQTTSSHVQHHEGAASCKATRPPVTHSLTSDSADLKAQEEELRLEAASCKAPRPSESRILDRAGQDTRGSSQVRADAKIVIEIVIGANVNDVTRVTGNAAVHQQQ